MVRRVVGLGLTFMVAFFAIVAAAADESKPADWSAWSPVGVWSGEISKLSKKATGFTLRRTVPPAAGAKGAVRFIRGRLKFGGHKNSAPFPSALVVFSPQNVEMRDERNGETKL